MGYSGTEIEILGECLVDFSYDGKGFRHKFLVVPCNKVNLLGRDICSKLGLQFCISNEYQSNNINDNVLSKFKDYLSPNFESCVSEEIELEVDPNAKPVFSRSRPIPIKLKDKVCNQIDKLVSEGKISKVFQSNWASPSVNVLKKDGTVRLCTDFSSTLNPVVTQVNAKLISVDEVIAQIGDAKFFSKIDLSQAFLQLPLSENSKKYTVMNTCHGLFQWNYLPFGLKSSPGIFQGFMNKVLNGINNIVIYQDDILVLTPTLKMHHEILNKVLETLKKAGIKLNTEKCQFYVDQVNYLGHVFDKKGVYPDPKKVSAIIDAPSPKNLKQLQSFIGLITFYARFVSGFSTLMHPLYQLLKKNVKFVWNDEQQKAFNKLKQIFQSDRVLSLYNPKNETMIECDSSGYGIGAALFQRKNESSDWKPIQFVSRSLNPAEINYSNIEREALSVVFGVEKFRKFLLGKSFIIRNDQKPLRRLFSHDSGVPTSGSARLQRWYLRLSQYNYKFEYSKGESNVTSDCLSRLPLPDTVPDSEPYELIFAINDLNNMPISFEDIKKHTLMDKNLVDLKHFIKFGFPSSKIDQKLSMYKKYSDRLSILKGCIMFDNRVLIPDALREMVLQQFHEDHPGIVAMKSTIRSLIWYIGINEDVEKLVKSCVICQNNRSKPSQKCHVEWPAPQRPWSRIHIDHFFYDNHICLLAIDSFSKYIECEIVKNTSVQETIAILRLILSRQGIPDTIISDNASCFTSFEFKNFMLSNGIEHITPPPYSPQSNGLGEVGVRVVKNLLKKGKNSGLPFRCQLAKVLFYYRSTPHSVTKVPPCVSLNNRKLVTLKDKINPLYSPIQTKSSHEKTIKQYNVGDAVLVLNPSSGPKWHRGIIVGKLGINVYNVFVKKVGLVWKRHLSQLLVIPHDHKDQSQNDSQTPDTDVYFPAGPISGASNASPILDETNDDEFHDALSENDVNLRRSTRISRPPIRYGIDV